ncbi:hypothetical protein [Ruegeria arenilitoris]|uniref:hypothetical protein n=1 Tax=Ruegeria arenilitoris TaxID=1173585 RepID=UPI001480AED0|nr:hypothetical protein [Ruegeria arenilitoris]
MNFRKGIFRIWLIFSVVWIAFVLIDGRPDLSLRIHWTFEQAAADLEDAIDKSSGGVVVRKGKNLSQLEAQELLTELKKRSDERYEDFVDTVLHAAALPVVIAFILISAFWVANGFRSEDRPS